MSIALHNLVFCAPAALICIMSRWADIKIPVHSWSEEAVSVTFLSLEQNIWYPQLKGKKAYFWLKFEKFQSLSSQQVPGRYSMA